MCSVWRREWVNLRRCCPLASQPPSPVTSALMTLCSSLVKVSQGYCAFCCWCVVVVFVCVCVCVFGGCCCYLEENWLSGCHPDGHHMMFCTSWVTLRWLCKKHVSKWRVKHSMAAENGQSVGTKIHSDCSDRLLHQLQTASTDCSTDCCYRLFYKL